MLFYRFLGLGILLLFFARRFLCLGKRLLLIGFGLFLSLIFLALFKQAKRFPIASHLPGASATDAVHLGPGNPRSRFFEIGARFTLFIICIVRRVYKVHSANVQQNLVAVVVLTINQVGGQIVTPVIDELTARTSQLIAVFFLLNHVCHLRCVEFESVVPEFSLIFAHVAHHIRDVVLFFRMP